MLVDRILMRLFGSVISDIHSATEIQKKWLDRPAAVGRSQEDVAGANIQMQNAIGMQDVHLGSQISQD